MSGSLSSRLLSGSVLQYVASSPPSHTSPPSLMLCTNRNTTHLSSVFPSPLLSFHLLLSRRRHTPPSISSRAHAASHPFPLISSTPRRRLQLQYSLLMAADNLRAPSSATKKGAKTAQESCLICDKVIKDGVAGQESILCEGECCQGWIHRTCAGLSKRAFQIVTGSADPFLCHYCSSLTLQREIKQLKQTVSSLQAEVESLRSVGNSPETTAYSSSPRIN